LETGQHGHRSVSGGLLGAGVVVVIVGLLVLAMPVRFPGGWAGFILDASAAPPAPFSLGIEIDPARGTISIPGTWPVDAAHSRFSPPADFSIEIAASGGGPVDVVATDPNGAVRLFEGVVVGDDSDAAGGVRVEPNSRQRLSFPVRDQPVTVRISSATGRLSHLDLTAPVSVHRVWLISVEGVERYPSSLVLALVMVGLGGGIIASAVRGPGWRGLSWSLVAGSGLVAAIGPGWCSENPLVDGDPDVATSAVRYLVLLSLPLVASGGFALGALNPTGRPKLLMAIATIAMVPVAAAIGLAGYLIGYELVSEDAEGVGYVFAYGLMLPTVAVMAGAAWMFGRVWRTRGAERNRGRKGGGYRARTHPPPPPR
jgi:hypothetical protein